MSVLGVLITGISVLYVGSMDGKYLRFKVELIEIFTTADAVTIIFVEISMNLRASSSRKV